MRPYVTLLRRELSSYFLGLSGYLLMAAVLMLLGLSFMLMLVNGRGVAFNAPLTEVFYNSYSFWLVMLLATPVITMRLFALEKFTGTFEALMTTPVSDLEVVLAKFSAALVFYLVIWLPMLACLHIVHAYTQPGEPFEWWPTASTYLGILLLGSLFLAMGCLASAVTRSQIIAATIGFVLGTSLFLLGFLTFGVTSGSGWLAHLAPYISVIQHMRDFARGVVDTRPVVFYVSGTVLFLFLTLKAVESRRWK
jgi:ABC-2 type transport system permease protein